MKKPLRLDSEAEEELEAAWRWYGDRRPALGSEFLVAVEEALRRLEGPTVSISVADVPEHLGVRRILVRRFPYARRRPQERLGRTE